MDSLVQIEGHFVDLIDDQWRLDELQKDHISVPTHELLDPEADSADLHLTLKEQDQKWTDIMLTSLKKMELPQIGKKCSDPSCKQLDFLPLQCECGQIFCSQHFSVHVQNCASHKNNQVEELRKIESFKCSKEGCKTTNIVPIICEKCQRNFCIEHRHTVNCTEKTTEEIAKEKERYAAPAREFQKAKSEVDKQVLENLDAARKKEKNRNLANKVQLMKIKNKANGLKSIPTADRIYFNVFHPKGGPCAVFISKNWSLGRGIDAIADECKLINKNNKNTEEKLRLFKKTTGEIISTNLSTLWADILHNGDIVDGESLIIEYVHENCLILK